MGLAIRNPPPFLMIIICLDMPQSPGVASEKHINVEVERIKT